jgi:CheY-like chemotaxis protein/anti-sigma regulatory factor (Ser/Thr protein kinase)
MTLECIDETEMAENNLKEIIKGANRAKELIQRLLTFSGKSSGEFKEISICHLMKESLEMIRSLIPATIEIEQHLEDIPPIMIDPAQIQQVIFNLCTNAYQAMNEKGGTLTVTMTKENMTPRRRLAYPDRDTDIFVKISIKDTGPGIPEAVMKKIFDPYFTTKEPGEGPGLGLAVVNGIVREHNGMITVESEVGVGTVFHIYLPLNESEKPETASVQNGPLNAGMENILVVDDDEQIRNMLKAMVEKLGYQATVASDSEEALQLFYTDFERFDLVITDMSMPGMNGLDLAREIMKIRSDLPVILCTGYSELVTDETVKETGIRDYLYKPVIMKDLAKTVRRSLC